MLLFDFICHFGIVYSFFFFLVCLVSVEFKSVYVRNLPSDISASEIEEEFKNFGTIKPDGVFLRNRKVIIFISCFLVCLFFN